MAYLVLVLPGRGFLVCEYLIAESMPPSTTSLRCGSRARSVVLCETVGRQQSRVFGQRMARQVEAEHFLFERQPLPIFPFGHVAQRGATLCGPFVGLVSQVEQSLLAALAIGVHGGAGLHGPIDGRHLLRARAPSESKAPALTSVSIGRAADLRGIDPLAEIEQIAERPTLAPSSHDGGHGRPGRNP